MRSTANLSSDTLRAIPGESASLQVSVHNPGDIVEAFQIDVIGLPAEWVVVEPAEVTLYPGTSETATVTVSPPRSPEAAAGETVFAIRVTPSENPDAVVAIEARLIIDPFTDLPSQLHPLVRNGRRGARFRLEADNRGNAVEMARVEPVATSDQITLAASPGTIEVAAGVRGTGRIRVRARKLLWWGDRREHQFGVILSTSDSDGVRLDGTFIQRPVFSVGLLKLLAALLALLMALAGLWFGLLRPQVRSAAREALADQNASRAAQAAPPAVAQQPKVAQSSAPTDGAGAGGGAASKPADGSETDQRSIAMQLRTKPGAQGDQVFQVDADKQFMVTDLMVDNVQGDEGVLRVTANGVAVFSLALENFRSQDYHSVTPIKIPAKAQLKLSVTCRTPGTPANAAAATTCFEELHATGIMTTVRP